MEPIRTMDFCVTSSRKGLRGSGLEVGQEVVVVGTRPLPVKRNDPYLQRVYSVVMVVTDEGIAVPNNGEGEEDNGNRSYLVDPRCLTKLVEERQLELKAILEGKDAVETSN